MSEPIKIEPYQAKQIVDYLYARAREAEGLVASLSFAKGELMCRVQFAEARVAELEKLLVREEKADAAWKWSREVGSFLKKAVDPPFCVELGEASRLFHDGIALGIIPEPDVEAARLKARDAIFGECGCAGHPEKFPENMGYLQKGICPKCGGRKI